MLHARLIQARLDRQLHVGSEIVIRQVRRRGVAKWCVGLKGEVVGRQVRRLEAKRGVDVGQRLAQRLPRQRKHQIQIEGVEMGGGEFGGAARFGIVVDAPERLEMARIETLDAERDACHPRFAEAREFGSLHRARVGFQRDFRIGQQRRERAHSGKNAIDAFSRKQAGSATAEKHAVDSAPPDIGQRMFQIL